MSLPQCDEGATAPGGEVVMVVGNEKTVIVLHGPNNWSTWVVGRIAAVLKFFSSKKKSANVSTREILVVSPDIRKSGAGPKKRAKADRSTILMGQKSKLKQRRREGTMPSGGGLLALPIERVGEDVCV